MKIVLDSNVIVAAFAGRGLCNSLLEVCLDRHTIIISEYILSEIYKALIKKIKMPDKNAQMIIDFLKVSCSVNTYEPLNRNISRDRKDDDILALALNSETSYIITGDKDLLSLGKFRKIKIISPREFWEITRKNSS